MVSWVDVYIGGGAKCGVGVAIVHGRDLEAGVGGKVSSFVTSMLSSAIFTTHKLTCH